MESSGGLDVFTYEDLESITKRFSAENFIGNTQYGKIYRGKMQNDLEPQEVTVKTWDCGQYRYGRKSPQSMLADEIKLLENSDVGRHPNLVKLIGYCCENGRFGVVYELRSLDTVQNLLPQDDFKWIARIKVALRFACLLEVLHGQDLVVQNIDAAHVMVDKAFNPRLLDFSVLVGGIFCGLNPDENPFVGSRNYGDPCYCLTERERDSEGKAGCRIWGEGEEIKREREREVHKEGGRERAREKRKRSSEALRRLIWGFEEEEGEEDREADLGKKQEKQKRRKKMYLDG